MIHVYDMNRAIFLLISKLSNMTLTNEKQCTLFLLNLFNYLGHATSKVMSKTLMIKRICFSEHNVDITCLVFKWFSFVSLSILLVTWRLDKISALSMKVEKFIELFFTIISWIKTQYDEKKKKKKTREG